MTKTKMPLQEAKAKILKALAHPSRIYIIETLAHGEKCVHEFVDEIGVDFSTISKHLAILRNAGIVQIDKRGQKVFYSLKTPCIIDFLSCIEDVLKHHLKEQNSLFEHK
ncbi:MAG: metalloregulator ArsR/SmtB family transcription factor [Lentisphaeria bacterium]